MTDAQVEALKTIHQRWKIEDDFETFKATALNMFGSDDAILINVGSMWLGIESDGYTHS